MKTKLFLGLLTFLMVSKVFAQGTSADQYYAMLDYEKAIVGYQKQVEKQKKAIPSVEVLSKLANSYFHLKDYPNSNKYFEQLYTIQKTGMNESDFIRLISTSKAVNKSDKADELMKGYYSSNTQKLQMLNYQKAKLDSLETEYKRISNLGSNSKEADFGVTMYNNEVLFTSNRSIVEEENAKKNYLNIFKANRSVTNGQLSNVAEYLSNLNTNYHDATPAFSPDFSMIYFSRNYLTVKEKLDVENGKVSNVLLMRAKVFDQRLVEIEALPFNGKDFNCSHPFITADGKQLFFSSDMPGGYGESDIYVADIYEDGSLSSPVNLGEMINTPGAELFPSMFGDTLFFSSNNHYGFGGLDLFSAIQKGKTNFTIPENLGEPMNSSADDFAYLRLPDRKGYFSSDRKGGKGNDDIYFFEMEEIKQFFALKGTVLTKGTDEPIPFADIKVSDLFGAPVATIKSDEKGNFDLVLPCNKQFDIEFSKKDFSTEHLQFATPEKKGEAKEDVRLTSFASLVVKDNNGIEKIKVDPIFFGYNKWDVTPQAEVELQKILFAMQTFPSIKIKIESHTDARGKDAYNLTLSDNRAKSTMAYLLAKGIDPSRIESAIGYGESRLKNKCKNGVKCTEEEHFVNRRSDFIIISK